MLSVFQTVLEMSLTASVVILVVLLARVLLSKAPKKYAYLLWIVVAFRLCVPFSFESSLSIFNTTDAIPAFDVETSVQETVSDTESVTAPETSDTVVVPTVPVTPNAGTTSVPEGTVSAPEGTVSAPVETPPVSTPVTPPVSGQTPEVSAPTTEVPNETPVETPVETPAETPAETPVVSTQKTNLRETIGVVLASVWALGIICMLGCGIISYIKLKKRLQNAVLLYDNVYGSDRIGSPFALGIFRPRIYIPFGMNEEATSYILAHERYHLKRLDHLVKPLAFLVLSVHWFNPFCWLAFNRMSLDMELSCDERVLKQFGDENMKKKYSKTLLDFATDNRYPTPTPISFSEGAGAKTRIKHALYWKKPRFWVSAIAILLCVVVLVACAANAVSKDPSDARPDRLIDFGDTPYQFTFASNGDGTCAITDIKTDYEHTEKYDLIIPETSPDGDKVVEVDMSVLGDYKDVFNVPGALTKETFSSIIDRIKTSEFKGENGVDAEDAADVVSAFYGSPLGQPSAEYVVLEPLIAIEEASRISAYLTDSIGYTAEDCYADCLAVLEPDVSEETAKLLKEQAFRFFYHDASNITKVILPSEDIKVHQSAAELTYELADGTAVELVYDNPFTVAYPKNEEDGTPTGDDQSFEVYSNNEETVIVTAQANITDFAFFELETEDGETYRIPDIHFTGRTLKKSHRFLLYAYISETFPNCGIGFRASDGEMRFYAIRYDSKDGGLYLENITDKLDYSLIVTIRVATEKDKANPSNLRYEEPDAKEAYDLIIETSETVTDLHVAQRDSNPPFRTRATFDTFAPATPLHLTVHTQEEESVWSVYFTDAYGEQRYYIIKQDETNGTFYLGGTVSTSTNPPVEDPTELTKFKVNNDLPFYEAILTLSDEGTESIATSLAIRDTETGDYLQTIEIEDDEYCQGKKPIAADVNFDHNLDILVLYQTPARADYYHAFVYDEASGKFVHAPSFAYIPNYKLDTENNRILGYSQGDMRVNYEVAEYDENVKDFVFTNSLYYEYIIDDADGDTIHFVEYENSKIVAEYTMQGNGNYYLVDENDDRMKPYLAEGSFWDLNSNKWHTPVQSNDEDIVASYDYNGGTLYHADLINSYNERLYLIKDDGTRVDICEQRLFSYLAFSDDQSKLIWNDYEWEWNATVCVYDIASQTLTTQPMDDLGTSYTPSYMAWLDNRYFLFVSQYDMGTITRGGDIFVYDTETHEYRILIDAYKEGSRELMIESFAANGQNITFGGYDYSYDADLYVDWTYTVTMDFVYGLITRGESVSLCVNDGELAQKPPQVPNGETLIESFQFEKGYIYHTQNNQTQKQFLRAMFYDGTVVDIYEDDCITYVDFDLSTERLIWNDYGSSAETTVCMYDLDMDNLDEDIVQDLDEGHTVSSMKWYAYHDRYILFVTQPVQGMGIHDGDVYIYDIKYGATVKIIDACDNLRITSIDERAELITAVYYNEADGSYTEMTYRITYEKLSALLEEQYGILYLRAEDCREVVAPLDCPVEVVPTDKEPSIKFDGDIAEVFEFTFTKDVKGFAIVKIDTGVAYDVTIDPLNEPTDYKAGDTLVYSMYINDISDSRGFVLIGEDGKLHYYAIVGPDPSGFTSGYRVYESTDHPSLTVDGKTPDFNP